MPVRWAPSTPPASAQTTWPSAIAPAASLASSPVQMPSPPMNRAWMPSCFIWRSIGPATASMPPKKMTSGFLPFRLVRIDVKSVALSVVKARATVAPPDALTPLSNSSATPCP